MLMVVVLVHGNNSDDDILLQADTISENISFGVVVRGSADDIHNLKSYIEAHGLKLVFKKASFENLYIINPREYQLLQQASGK